MRFVWGVVFAFLLILLISGLLFRDSMTDYVSEHILPETGVESMNADSVLIDSAYNYSKTGFAFQVTYLEFGSTLCRECKMMEEVMKRVEAEYVNRVNVVFCNVLLKENKSRAKHYGILRIPVQVLLDRNGKECFRHVGYLSFNDLTKELKKHGVQ